ncbi:Alpha/Beta hydrolase protein [Pelagophyceae sp. CCMP2097]|nr:Alpha/Beta hydrolase protein [Pelagophyceae sp. CCMP2097]
MRPVRAAALTAAPAPPLAWGDVPALEAVYGLYGPLRRREECAVVAVAAAAAAAACLSARRHTVRALAPRLAAVLLLLLAARQAVREVRHAPRLRPAADLAIKGSRFADIRGIGDVHYLDGADALSDALPDFSYKRTSLVLHASHGFGANSLTLAPLLRRLALRTRCAAALAHDHPGFGLTARPKDLKPYELNGDVALQLARQSGANVDSPRYCFVGHSMGCLSALEAAVKMADSAPTALVLVAPALSAAPSKVSGRWPVAQRLAGIFSRAPLAWPARLFLRRLVAAPNFWPKGLGACWAPPPREDADLLQQSCRAYGLAGGCAGWDAGLVRFCAARLRQVTAPSADVVKQAAALISAGKLTALVIQGKQDAIVPAAGTRRLVAALGAVGLMEVDECGHCPQEEYTDAVVQAIAGFVGDDSS